MLQSDSPLHLTGINLLAPVQTKSGRAQAAASWFLRSGIQGARGGVARYFRGDLGQNARVSTEITGYAVGALVYLSGCTGDTACLEAARRAGDFLIADAWDERLKIFPFEHSHNGDIPNHLAYFFDSGIIVRGLLALWRRTSETRFLDAARRAGESMKTHFHAGDRIHPILQLPTLDPLPYTSQWSRGPGCYQLKSALAWWDLGQVTGMSTFGEWYEDALAAALASHDSFLPAESPERTMDRLHAYSYFLEGVLPATGRPEIKKALTIGITRVAGYLREIAPRFERSDVYAQLLRVRLFADQFGAVPLNRREAEEEAGAIAEFQIGHDDVRFAGGYAFGRKAGVIIPHMNPVSTAFCSQALEMWDDHAAGRRLNLQSLV
jgi:hypothetical protein